MSTTLSDIQRGIREAADPAAVARLEALRPARAWRDLALDWALIAMAIGTVAALRTPWAWGLGFALVGAGQYRLFVLGHEGLHGTLHPDRRVNDRVARWLIYGPLFVGFDDSRRGHLTHHRELGSPDDPERYIHGLDNKNSRRAIALLCTGLLTFARTVQKVLPWRALSNPTDLRSFVTQRGPVFVAQAALITAFVVADLPWWSWLVLWVAPIYVFVFVADEIRTFCDHAVPSVPDTAGDPDRLISYHPGPLEAWLLAPHKVHYQAEHHLWPTIPYYHLAAAAALTGARPEVEVRPSYAGFLGALWRSVPLTPTSS